MNIRVEVNGQTVVEMDLMHLLFMRAYEQGLKFHPAEGSRVELLAVVNDRTWCWEEITMEYDIWDKLTMDDADEG